MTRQAIRSELIRLFLVEDHPVTTAGVIKALEREKRIVIVGCCESGIEAMQKIPLFRPDIVLMDLGLPGLNGIHVTKALLADLGWIEVIWFSASPAAGLLRIARRLGVRGYIQKNYGPEELARCILAVWKGAESFAPSVFCDPFLLDGDSILPKNETTAYKPPTGSSNPNGQRFPNQRDRRYPETQCPDH